MTMIFWSFDHPAAGWRLASWLKEQSAAASAPPEHKRVTAAALALLDAMNGTTALTSRILWTALYETAQALECEGIDPVGLQACLERQALCLGGDNSDKAVEEALERLVDETRRWATTA